MAINIRQVIRNAYVTAGVISDYDDEVDGNRISSAVNLLNNILGQLNAEQLISHTQQVVEHTVATESRELTIGPTGNIVTERPAFINSVVYLTSADSSAYTLIQTDLSSLIGGRTSSGGVPTYFAYAPNMDDGKIYLSCKAAAGSIVALVFNTAIPVVTIESTLNLPADYENLFMYALAREIGVREKAPSLNVERCDKLYTEAVSRSKLANGRNQVPMMITNAACGDIRSGWWL